MQAVESPIMTPSTVGGSSPHRRDDISDDLGAAMLLPRDGRGNIASGGALHSLLEDHSLATEHHSIIDSQQSLMARGNDAYAVGGTDITARAPAVDGPSDESGGLLLEHFDSWSSEAEDSSHDQDSISEWIDSTPVRGGGALVRRYTQQELDEYEHELALDASASGIETLDLVENELRDEKVRELLAAVGATPAEEQKRHTELGLQRVEKLKLSHSAVGAEVDGTVLRTGGNDAHSSTQLRAKFAHLLG